MADQPPPPPPSQHEPHFTRATKKDQLAATKASYNVQVTVARGIYDSAENAIAVAANYRNRPTQVILDELRRCHTEHRETYGYLLQLCRDILYLSDSEEEKQTFKELQVSNRKAMDKLGRMLMEEISTYERGLRPRSPPIAAPPPVQAPAIHFPNRTLLPNKLLETNTPAEMRQWINSFTAFYSSSNLAARPILEQQAHVYNLVDANLRAKLELIVQPNHPIFPNEDDDDDDDPSVMNALREIFLDKYPLDSRRMTFFEYKQKPKQKPTDWSRALDELSLEADYTRINAETLMIFRYMTSVTDQKLLKLFLREENPSIARLKKILTDYERNEQRFHDITGKDGSTPQAVNRVAANGKKSKGNNKQSSYKKGKNPANNNSNKGQNNSNSAKSEFVPRDKKLLQLAQKGLCLRCGNKYSENHNCPAQGVACKNCGKNNHFAKVCQSAKKEDNGSTNKARCVNPNSRPTSPHSDYEGERVNVVYSSY